MFNNIGPAGLLLIAVVVLVLFGRGKVAGLMNEGKAEIENAAADGARDITPAPEKDKV